MFFNYEPIPYKKIKSRQEYLANGKMSEAIKQRYAGESVGDVMWRIYGKKSGITHRIAFENEVMPTQTSGHHDIWTESGNHPSLEDIGYAQTFPEDYDYGANTYSRISYVCGMSVPPVMIKRIVERIMKTGVFDREEAQ